MQISPKDTPRCFYQDPKFRPRYPIMKDGCVDMSAFPNRCIRCYNDSGNWNCEVYRKINSQSVESDKKVLTIETPQEYKKDVVAEEITA